MTEVEYIRQNAKHIGRYVWGGEVECEVWHDESAGRLCYLDGNSLTAETSDGYANQKQIELFPDIWVVRIFDTECFDEDWLLERGIGRTWNVYVINKTQHFHICSVEASYEAFLIDSGFEFTDPDSVSDDDRDRIDEEFRDSVAHDERVSYFSKSYIDRLPADQVHHHGIEATKGELLTDGDVMEGCCEHYSANTIW